MTLTFLGREALAHLRVGGQLGLTQVSARQQHLPRRGLGRHSDIDGLAIERVPEFPVRVTVHFYKATSHGVANEADLDQAASQIERLYDGADYVDSLVVDGPSERPTEYDGSNVEPARRWDTFWHRFEGNVGMTRTRALQLPERLGAVSWHCVLEPVGCG